MSDPLFDEDDEANTPLTEEERSQLIPTYITQRRELNEAELANIIEASKWLSARKRDVLNDAFLRELHTRMFGKVWHWAGKYRTISRNIGIEAYRIPTEDRQLVDDARYQVENETYPPDEITVRFS
jgi:Fic-DOC domain mobile mystery protein B